MASILIKLNNMTVGELKEKLKNVSDDKLVSMYFDDGKINNTLDEIDFGYEYNNNVILIRG